MDGAASLRPSRSVEARSGPATWSSLADDTVAVLRTQAARLSGKPASITRGTALALSFHNQSLDAVVTDPPYDEMIASDMIAGT